MVTLERWLPVDDHPGYEVSDHGWVRTYRDLGGHPRSIPRIMKGSWVKGYHLVKFGRGPMKRVHQLVLEHFVGPGPEGTEPRHLDGDPTHNHLSNLAWGTRAENYNDRRSHGTENDGMRNGRAKLTNDQVRAIRESHESGVALAEQYDVTPTTIGQIRNRVTWRHL